MIESAQRFSPVLDIGGLNGNGASRDRVDQLGAQAELAAHLRDRRDDDRARILADRDFGGNIALILGEDFFQHVDVEFDLAHNAVRLFQPRDCDGVPLAYWTSGAFGEAEIETLNEAQPRIVLQVKINGESLDALLDSGASASMLSSGTAARLGVTTQTPGVVAMGSSIGIGSTTVAVYGASFQSFAIGNETIRDAMILFGNTGTDSSHTSAGSIIRYTMGQRTGMILGVDFLKAHRVLVAHSRRKIYFTYIGGPVFEKKWASSSAHSQ